MTFAAIIAMLPALFKFWDEVTQLIKLLQGTPEQDHQKLMAQVTNTFNEASNNGRPG